jgi:hypothetical protein
MSLSQQKHSDQLSVVFKEQLNTVCAHAASVARQINAAIDAGAEADDLLPFHGMCLAELCMILNLCDTVPKMSGDPT